DLVVIGGGLAGLSAALTVLDRGGTVVVLEKQGHLGGNSAWASSGVNAVDVNNTKSGDSVASFTADTLRGAQIPNSTLIPVLTAGSVDSLAWLRSRLAENLELDLVGQMGGHSFPRTHRPSQGLAGSAIIFALEKQLKKYLHKTHDGGAQYELRKWTRATSILTSSDGATVAGVSYGSVTAKDPDTLVATGTVMARHVLIATGGYASDYTETSLLQKHRPDLLKYATTNNKGTTGDGHKLALAVGAKAVDLDDVQVHPTGFHNPADPDNKVKQLCAEILRGEGAILLSRQKGERFADELGTRDYVTGRMIETDPASLLFALVLNAAAAAKAATHISLYTKKKLIFKFETLEDLAAWDFWGEGVQTASLDAVMRGYDAAAVAGVDSFGKTFFHNTPFAGAGPFYAGIVTPVIHYCMGGIAIGTDGSVLNHEGAAIPGLFAAGEVIGGLHGRNRLGGNALSECVVFGRVIGEALPLGEGSAGGGAGPPSTAPGGTAPGGKGAAPGEGEGAAAGAPGLRSISKQELGQHKTEESCWVSIQGKVYDFTSFLDEHPAGAEAILKYGGEDGTEIFEAIHTQEMLDDFTPIGLLAAHQPSAAL
ncbi:FAD binding domain-containing protein, partial [Baffinella frigidus]